MRLVAHGRSSFLLTGYSYLGKWTPGFIKGLFDESRKGIQLMFDNR